MQKFQKVPVISPFPLHISPEFLIQKFLVNYYNYFYYYYYIYIHIYKYKILKFKPKLKVLNLILISKTMLLQLT